ncbi:MAG: hypothetical protein ABJP82_19400 [Hyphomicrobiales bacterium]
MRRILVDDFLAALDFLVSRPAADCQRNARELVENANVAYEFWSDYGRVHALWGNGSLMSAAQAMSHSGSRRYWSFDQPDVQDSIKILMNTLDRAKHFHR